MSNELLAHHFKRIQLIACIQIACAPLSMWLNSIEMTPLNYLAVVSIGTALMYPFTLGCNRLRSKFVEPPSSEPYISDDLISVELQIRDTPTTIRLFVRTDCFAIDYAIGRQLELFRGHTVRILDHVGVNNNSLELLCEWIEPRQRQRQRKYNWKHEGF